MKRRRYIRNEDKLLARLTFLLPHVKTSHFHLAAAGRDQITDAIEQGCFPRTVVTLQNDHLPCGDSHIQRMQRLEFFELFAQVDGLQGRHG
jgi:hypothetical protein